MVKGLDNESNTRMWDYLHLLGSLCNHPSILYEVLAERVAENKNETKGKGKLKNAKSKQDKPTLSDQTLTQARLLLKKMKEEGVTKSRNANLSAKVPVINAIIEESKKLGEQVLVFTHHQHMLNYLETMVPNLPGRPRCFRLDGKTDMSKRLGLVKDFNKGAADVFLISTKAGGLGLNIAGANRVILCDFDFNPSHEEQAVGRAYRIGQKKEVFVYHLVTGGTYEEKLHHVTIFKRQLARRVVDDKNPKRAASKTGAYFFEPKHVEASLLEEFVGKDKVMDKVLYSAPGNMIRHLQTTETMHADSEELLDEAEEKEVREMIADDKLRKNDHAAWQRKQYGTTNSNLAKPPLGPSSTALHPLANALKMAPPSAHGPSAPTRSSPTVPMARMVQPTGATAETGNPPEASTLSSPSSGYKIDRRIEQLLHGPQYPSGKQRTHPTLRPQIPGLQQPSWIPQPMGPGPGMRAPTYQNDYTGLYQEGREVNKSDIPIPAEQRFLAAEKQKRDMISKVAKDQRMQKKKAQEERQWQQTTAESLASQTGGNSAANAIDLGDSD